MFALPNPPRFFCLHRAGFPSRTLHHQQDLLRAHNCYRPVQIPSLRSLFANGGAAAPPTPGLAKTEAIWTFFTPHAGSLFANGGLRLPQPPRFFKLCKKTSSIILPAKTEPIWTLSEPVIKTLCLQMGGAGLRPPPSPRFLFTPCRLAFKNIAPSARLASCAQLL